MPTILDFWSEWFELFFFIYKSPPDTYYQVKRQLAFPFNIDFQDGTPEGQLGFPISMIFPTKFQVNKPYTSEKV